MDFIVEYVDRNGSIWSRYGRDSNEGQAIRMAENLASTRSGARVRVVDNRGNVRFLI